MVVRRLLRRRMLKISWTFLTKNSPFLLPSIRAATWRSTSADSGMALHCKTGWHNGAQRSCATQHIYSSPRMHASINNALLLHQPCRLYMPWMPASLGKHERTAHTFKREPCCRGLRAKTLLLPCQISGKTSTENCNDWQNEM